MLEAAPDPETGSALGFRSCFNWAAHPLRRYIGTNICQAVETPQAESRALAYVTNEDWSKVGGSLPPRRRQGRAVGLVYGHAAHRLPAP